MGLFTVGNLITLGIALLILILFRQTDKNNRHMKKLRDYSDILKEDLSSFVKEQENAIKDFGVSLNVERDSAKELMKRLQITEEELAGKAAAMAHIDGQIKSYENSLAELDRMTSRVQENMNRVREESAFVESTGKRLTEVKGRLEEMSKELGTLEARFGRENSAALEQAVESTLADVKSVVSDLRASAETIERQVDDHRQEINKIEQSRAAGIARDVDHINQILKTAVEQAGKRADKMEEAALSALREQADERIRRLKTAEEERLKGYQESAKTRVADVQALIKGFRDEWQAERAAWEGSDKATRDERKKDIKELNASLDDSEKRLLAAKAAFGKQSEDLSQRMGQIVSSQEAMLAKTAEDMKQKALEITGARLEEYRRAQDAEFKRLEALADDSKKLDAELRRGMQETIAKTREEFYRHEEESANIRKLELDKFAASAASLRKEMGEIEKEVSALKSAAYDNVSEKLKGFEDNFFADLSKRSGDIDQRLVEWQDVLAARLSKMEEEAEAGRRELERALIEETRKQLSVQDARLVSDLEHLKAETSAFGESIRGEMNAADESMRSLKEQLAGNLEEARKGADSFIKAEVSKYSLAAAETIKQHQRELGEKLRELDEGIDDARSRVKELSAETDSRVAAVRSSVEDTERHIREAVDQAKLIDKADALRLDLGRRIEDLKTDIDRLDQRRAEAFQLENDFVKIKRLEDDVNAKMTRFLSEKRKIETMEADFNRLLKISHAVEEKLAQVTGADDTLQGMQLQLRKLEEALGTTDDKFQRIERKNQVLDNTNDGIDRNFRSLQESEKLSSKIGDELVRYADDLTFIKTSIEKLSGESERAREAVDKIEVLDKLLEEIEARIDSMQRARQWVAGAETRLEELNRQALIQTRAIDSTLKGKKSGAVPNLGEGSPPVQKKENVITLAKQGWKVDEIAKALKISRGEVELILDLAPGD
ncbi:MAG: hypothetical protein FWC65_02580 [Treponema sp.]|nr:hypothetical protein [Treponema sp.]